jgi:hypothetical protein
MPFLTTLRIYWPKPEAFEGEWKQRLYSAWVKFPEGGNMRTKLTYATVILGLSVSSGVQSQFPALPEQP